MKLNLLLFMVFTSFYCQVASAAPTPLPTWLNDDKGKVWAVDYLIDSIKDAEFYKIRDFEIKRQIVPGTEYESLEVKIVFDDPKCSGRWATIIVLAPSCTSEGCDVVRTLTTCVPDSNANKDSEIFRYRTP